jgi:hypothetical protein
VDELTSPAPGLTRPAPAAFRPVTVPRPRHRAGLAWYWLALLILLAGMAWPLLGVRATDLKIASLTRVPLPAGGRVRLPHGGSYVINYEAAGASEGTLPHFRVRARPLTPSLRVGLQVNTSDDMYGTGRTEGIAVLNLTVSGPGTVYLDGPGAPAVAGGSALAVGPGIPGFLVTVVPGIGLMLLGIGGIILTATVRSQGAVKRVRYRSIVA